MHEELQRFDPQVPIEQARTPPSSWYLDPAIHRLELERVFRRCWQAVGRTDQLQHSGQFTSGELAGQPWLALRAADGQLRGFYNVCRHHAAALVSGEGSVRELVCPYHGWTYDLDGRLRRAPRLGATRGFDRDCHGLVGLQVESRGPFVFLRLDRPDEQQGDASLDSLLRPLAGRVDLTGPKFVKRVEYEIECNWKVFVDNYLDGGYHVEFLHRGLASQLDLNSYHSEIDGRVSLQICRSEASSQQAQGVDFSDRLGAGAVYAFVYPNFMINRYGPMMDTNWAVPLGPQRTRTVFDYYFDADCDADFIERSLEASDRVQQEDIAICESVQRGLASSAFDRGPYAALELPAYHFHGLLAADLLG